VRDEASFDRLRSNFAAMWNIPPQESMYACAPEQPVEFGENLGYKYAMLTPDTKQTTYVKYLLRVKGGLLSLEILGELAPFDEHRYEAIFHSLRIEGR
jgi:hypothetical protein